MRSRRLRVFEINITNFNYILNEMKRKKEISMRFFLYNFETV